MNNFVVNNSVLWFQFHHKHSCVECCTGTGQPNHPLQYPPDHPLQSTSYVQSTIRDRSTSGIKQQEKGKLLEQKINRGCIRHGLASPCSCKTVTVGTHILFPLHYSLSLACQDNAYLPLTPAAS